MGKRSNFERRDRDFYPTPYEAVGPLLGHLYGRRQEWLFVDPCAGDGSLIDGLRRARDDQGYEHFMAFIGSDIRPLRKDIAEFDAFDLRRHEIYAQLDIDQALTGFITNPPWDWEILSPLISHLSDIAPTWLLLNADLMHNRRMAKHMTHCVKVVSVGRVSWMNNGKKGFENAAWYLFDAGFECNQTQFYARAA